MKIKSFILMISFCLSACTFTPLYGNKSELMKQVASVQVEPVQGEGSYQMGLNLTTKLNPEQLNVQKRYQLKVQIEKPVTSNESIRTDNFATLGKMVVTVQYQLFDKIKNEEIINSSVRSNGLYNIIKDPYSTVVSEDKLYSDLLNSLSDDIVLHVFAYFKGQK